MAENTDGRAVDYKVLRTCVAIVYRLGSGPWKDVEAVLELKPHSTASG